MHTIKWKTFYDVKGKGKLPRTGTVELNGTEVVFKKAFAVTPVGTLLIYPAVDRETYFEYLELITLEWEKQFSQEGPYDV